jgi:hypothetical protein
MSLYEMESMMRSFVKLDKDKMARPMNDNEFDNLKAAARRAMPDVRF